MTRGCSRTALHRRDIHDPHVSTNTAGNNGYRKGDNDRTGNNDGAGNNHSYSTGGSDTADNNRIHSTGSAGRIRHNRADNRLRSRRETSQYELPLGSSQGQREMAAVP